MICIVGTRGSGRSSALIEMSENTGLPIVTASSSMADAINHQADAMGKKIPPAKCRLFRGKHTGVYCRLLVDDAQNILQRALGFPVEVAVFDADRFDFSGMGLFDLLAAWWKSRRVEEVG